MPRIAIQDNTNTDTHAQWRRLNLVSLAVAGHGDAGGGDGGEVRTDLVQTQRVLHPLLCPVHQHLLELYMYMWASGWVGG